MQSKRSLWLDNRNECHRRLIVVRIEQTVRFMLIVYHDFGFSCPSNTNQLFLGNVGDQITVRVDLNYGPLDFTCHRC